MRRMLVALVLALGALVAPAAAHAATADPARVRVYDYDLGDSAYHVRGFHGLTDDGMLSKRIAPIELIGRVYAPADAAGQRLPLVVIAHGLFWSCSDDAGNRTSQDWPCRGRFEGIHSERGYDYLGRTLAARGMLVVSVSANGINAGEMGEPADRARAQLVFEHLRLWRNLVENGAGRLVGAFTDARTGRAATPDFGRAIDFRDVGLVGHSRGGRGMMWAAADAHRARVPDGVRFRAVVGLAAAGPPFMDRRAHRVAVGRVPLLEWTGGCDATGDDSYNRLARRRGNPVNIDITVHGANHNNLNSRWAAHSGLPGGEDDAYHPDGRPGRCYASDPGELQDTLGYRAEQKVAATYLGAFLRRYLQGDTSVDRILSGERKPVAHLTRVDVERYAPAGK